MKLNKSKSNKLKHYLSSGILTTIAGIITFPVLTRILSKSDYGYYSLIQGGQLIYEAVLKCGCQLSVFRHYPDMMKGKGESKDEYLTNIFLLPLAVSFIISFVIILGIILYSLLVSQIFIFVLVIITAQSSILISYFHSYMQASGSSKSDAIVDIINKYLYLILVIPIVLYLSTDYWGVYWSICIASLVTSFIVVYINRNIFSSMKIKFNIDVFCKGLKYSFPLFLTEISAVSISYIDRFSMVYMGIEVDMIGLYSIGIGLANVLFILIWKVSYPMIFPKINELHDSDNISHSIETLSQATNLFIIFSISILTGVFLNCQDFVVILSGEDKEGASIFFFFGITILLFKILGNFLFHGLDLQKRSGIILKSELIIMFFNIILNIILIPIFGIYGAVLASFISIPFGFFYKYMKLDNNYRVVGYFDGVLKILLLLLVYIAIHYFIVLSYFDSSVSRLIVSVFLFSIIFFFGKKFWLYKLNGIFFKNSTE